MMKGSTPSRICQAGPSNQAWLWQHNGAAYTARCAMVGEVAGRPKVYLVVNLMTEVGIVIQLELVTVPVVFRVLWRNI